MQHNKDYPDCVELTGNRFRAESKSYKQNYYCKDSKCVAKARKFSSMKEFLGHHNRRHRDKGKGKELTAERAKHQALEGAGEKGREEKKGRTEAAGTNIRSPRTGSE